MAKRDVITICQDSREQNGLERDFDGLDCTIETNVTVPVFDYCLRFDGEIDLGFAIERKSLEDFVNSVTTTEGWRRELAKIGRCGFSPVIYVVECDFEDILPQRRCFCWYERTSARCGKCGGHGYPFCECVQERPNLNCEKCGGNGYIGYNYERRKITPQFVYHRLFELMMRASVLFCGSRVAAAASIEGLLRRRHEYLKVKAKANAKH